MNQPIQTQEDSKGLLNAVPAWGSYLYQNFLVPAFSPTASMSEWLNLNTPFGALTPRALGGGQTQASNQQLQTQQQAPSMDYFGSNWAKDVDNTPTQPTVHRMSEPAVPQQLDNPFALVPQTRSHTLPVAPSAMQQNPSPPQFANNSQAGPSTYYSSQSFYYNNTIPTSVLVGAQISASNANLIAANMATASALRGSSAGFEAAHTYPGSTGPTSRTISPKIENIDHPITHSPSPLTSAQQTPQLSPKRAAKRRCDSLDSDDHSEAEHEVPEGVERDGMIWGMRVEDYRGLSARERKRVRNRISARTFRAKRKEHLSSLEVNMGAKDLQLRLANEEALRLRSEVADLKRRLARYENI